MKNIDSVHIQQFQNRLNTSQYFNYRHQHLNPFQKTYCNAYQLIQSTPPSILSIPKQKSLASTQLKRGMMTHYKSLNSSSNSSFHQSVQSNLPNLKKVVSRLKYVISPLQNKNLNLRLKTSNNFIQQSLVLNNDSRKSCSNESNLVTESTTFQKMRDTNIILKSVRRSTLSKSQDMCNEEVSQNNNEILSPVRSQYQNAPPLSSQKRRSRQKSIIERIQSEEYQSFYRDNNCQDLMLDQYILGSTFSHVPINIQRKKRFFPIKIKNKFSKQRLTKKKPNESPDYNFTQSSRAFTHKMNQMFQSQHHTTKQSRTSIVINKRKNTEYDIKEQFTMESNFLDDQDASGINHKMKSQTTSPRLALQNQLSVIPPYAQQHQMMNTRAMTEQSLKVIVEAIEKVDETQQTLSPVKIIVQPKDRFKISVCVIPPILDELEINEQFYAPQYFTEIKNNNGEVKESQDEEEAEQKLKKPVRLSLTNSSQKIPLQSYSNSILKIISLENSPYTIGQGGLNKIDNAIFVTSKVRRYLKLYLQNKLQKILKKVDHKVNMILLFLKDRKSVNQLAIVTQQQYDIYHSGTSRLHSELTLSKFTDNRTHVIRELLRFMTQIFDPGVKYDAIIWDKQSIESLIEEKRKSLFMEPKIINAKWIKRDSYIESDSDNLSQCELSDLESECENDNKFHNDFKTMKMIEFPWTEVSCAGILKTQETICAPIISEVDDWTRNQLIGDSQILTQDHGSESLIQENQTVSIFYQVGHLYGQIINRKNLKVILMLQDKYKEILLGAFEDFSELQGMSAQYGLLAFEESALKIVVKSQSSNQLLRQSTAESNDKLPISLLKVLPVRQNFKRQTTKNQLEIISLIEPRIELKRQNSRRSPTCYITTQKSAFVQPNDSPSTSLTPLRQLHNQLSLNSNESFQVSQKSQKRLDDVNLNYSDEKNIQKRGIIQKQATMTSIKSTNMNDMRLNNSQHKYDSSPVQQIRSSSRQRQNSMAKFSLQMRTHVMESIRRKAISLYKQISYLVLENKFAELEELLQHNPNLKVDERDDYGNTFLIVAAQSGFTEIVTQLLEKGASVNMQNNEGDTPLHKALMYNNYKVADLLINAGASQNIRNHQNISPWQNTR